jgi:hypothetical protein
VFPELLPEAAAHPPEAVSADPLPPS